MQLIRRALAQALLTAAEHLLGSEPQRARQPIVMVVITPHTEQARCYVGTVLHHTETPS